MLYHAGPSSLVFFAECLKIITDSNLQIQSYKIQVQLKPKLHQLWRIALWLGKLQPSVFLKIVWVFWLERVVPSLVIAFFLECFDISTLWSQRVLRADRKADVNQTYQQSVFSPIGACIRIWCTAGTVERRSQMFVYRPFRFSLSPPRSTKCLFTGYVYFRFLSSAPGCQSSGKKIRLDNRKSALQGLEFS